MKRRSFIKTGALGMSFLAAGVARAGEWAGLKGKKGRVFGIPDSVRRRTPADRNLIRYSVARTDLPPVVWDDVVGLAALAQDVFDRPGVAQAFSRDPNGYLETIGLGDVKLDPRAIEVRIALALGDPDVRWAIEKNDPGAFVKAIEHRGLLQSPEPSVFAGRLAAQVEMIRQRMGDDVSPQACTLFSVCIVVAAIWVWVAIAQDAVVVVNIGVLVGVYAVALIQTSVIGRKMMVPEAGLLAAQAPFRLAGAMGGSEFAEKAIGAFLDTNVERIATAVEGLAIYRENRPMKATELRTLVRQQMTRHMSGHSVLLESGQP